VRHPPGALTAPRSGLRIGLIAPAWVPVPPPQYGGTELVIDLLARGLTAAGQAVRLFTTGDSTCPVERHWVHPTAVGTTGTLLDELGHVESAYADLSDCDVIHDHTLLGPLWAVANGATPPVATTNHGEFTPQLTALYRTVADHVAVVAISHHQRSTAPTVPVARVIHHGIDVDAFPFGRGDGGYVVFLGRMSPDKGVHRAIAVARAAGKRVLIAAKMWEPAERRYFEEVVAPLLGDDAIYIGQVGGRQKLDLLAGAEALVNPIRWPEPFGLVMIEALAAGTPVLAFAEGAAPEIIDHGRTGFVCADEAEMTARLHDVARLDRTACRHDAEVRFSTRRMVDDHLALYRELVAQRRARKSPTPSVIDSSGPLPRSSIRATV
jgi:glycosyltransferase involved in cell wall biosynthesis